MRSHLIFASPVKDTISEVRRDVFVAKIQMRLIAAKGYAVAAVTRRKFARRNTSANANSNTAVNYTVISVQGGKSYINVFDYPSDGG